MESSVMQANWERACELVGEIKGRNGWGYRNACQIGPRCRVLISGQLGQPIIRSARAVGMDPHDFVAAALVAAILEAGGFTNDELATMAENVRIVAEAEEEKAERDRRDAVYAARVAAAERACAAATARYEVSRTAAVTLQSQLNAAERRIVDLRNGQARRQSGGWLARFSGGKGRRDETDYDAAIKDVQGTITRLKPELDKARAEFEDAAADMRKLFEASQPRATVEERDKYDRHHGVESPRYELSPIGLAGSNFELPV